MQIPESGIENLRGFGYTEDQAQFLYLVATHSGYFSARQYLSFSGAKSGEKSMAFTQKVLGKGHANAHLLLRNGRVYHLYSRLVYRAIGRENLRNRREHSVEHIRTKLATLDFVLAHLDHRYLETESEKVAYFCKDLGLKQFRFADEVLHWRNSRKDNRPPFRRQISAILRLRILFSPCGYLQFC